MHDLKQYLGGRLPLFDPQDMTRPQKNLYGSINSKRVTWAESAGFKVMLKDEKLIGPFNTIL